MVLFIFKVSKSQVYEMMNYNSGYSNWENMVTISIEVNKLLQIHRTTLYRQ